MKLRRPVFLGLIFFMVGVSASLFTQQSVTPELSTSLWPALPAFIVFVMFLAAILSSGALIRKKLKLPFFTGAENGLVDLALGSASLYVLSYALTAIHLFSSDLRVLLWLILSVIFALGSSLIQMNRWFDFAKSTWSKVLLAVPLLIVLLRLIEGLQFHLHGDAYVTYLPAPRIWAQTGNFRDFLRFSQFFLSTSWESLYAWGTALMGLKGGAGLDVSQFFSQWCTGGIGITGIILATLALGARLSLVFPISSMWFPVVAVSALQIPILRWTANLAKHDMGVAFWGFSAFYFTLFLAPLSPALAFLAGVLTGTAVIGKLTVSILGICLGLHVLIFSTKRTPWFALGGILGGMPVFLRNYFLTTNPVFPWMSNHFPTPYLSKGQAEATLHPTASAMGTSGLGSYFMEIHEQLPLWIILVVALVMIKKRKEFLKFIWAPVAATILFTLVFRSSTEIRYQNANLVIMEALICFFAFYLIKQLPKKIEAAGSALFAVAIIGTANITTFTLFQIGSSKFAPVVKKLPTLTGGEGKLWIRQNLKPTDKVLAMGDPHVFYTLDYTVSEINQTPEWDDRLSDLSTKEFEKSVMESDFEYLYIATDVPYWVQLPKGVQILKDLNEGGTRCKVFTSEKAEIWDLKCLRKPAGV